VNQIQENKLNLPTQLKRRNEIPRKDKEIDKKQEEHEKETKGTKKEVPRYRNQVNYAE
jgi:hypothetical protein